MKRSVNLSFNMALLAFFLGTNISYISGVKIKLPSGGEAEMSTGQIPMLAPHVAPPKEKTFAQKHKWKIAGGVAGIIMAGLLGGTEEGRDFLKKATGEPFSWIIKNIPKTYEWMPKVASAAASNIQKIPGSSWVMEYARSNPIQFIGSIGSIAGFAVKKAMGRKSSPSRPADDASKEDIQQFKDEALKYLADNDLHFLEKVVSFESEIAPFEEIEQEEYFTKKELQLIAPFKRASLTLHDVASDILQEFEEQPFSKEETKKQGRLNQDFLFS